MVQKLENQWKKKRIEPLEQEEPDQEEGNDNLEDNQELENETNNLTESFEDDSTPEGNQSLEEVLDFLHCSISHVQMNYQ